jgi:hypothetical protein
MKRLREEEETVYSLAHFPREILLFIFSFLQLEDIGRLTCTNKLISGICNSLVIWENIFGNLNPKAKPSSENWTCKDRCKFLVRRQNQFYHWFEEFFKSSSSSTYKWGPKMTKKEISQLEQSHHITLPREFRHILKHYGNGLTVPCTSISDQFFIIIEKLGPTLEMISQKNQIEFVNTFQNHLKEINLLLSPNFYVRTHHTNTLWLSQNVKNGDKFFWPNEILLFLSNFANGFKSG